eukprot:1144513-Pelagomonas_calceolata.AAC.1
MPQLDTTMSTAPELQAEGGSTLPGVTVHPVSAPASESSAHEPAYAYETGTASHCRAKFYWPLYWLLQRRRSIMSHHENQQYVQQATAMPTTVEDLKATIQTVTHETTQAVLQTQMGANASALPKHLRNSLKAKQYENREKSGKFRAWARDMRSYIKFQGLYPEVHTQADLCRMIVEMNCQGEALAHMQRLAKTTPRTDSFWTFEGLLHALDARFTHAVKRTTCTQCP